MPAAARSKMRRTRVFRSRRSSAPLHNIFNKHMRNNTHLLMQHGMHNMCNALRIGADDVETVLRAFFNSLQHHRRGQRVQYPHQDCTRLGPLPRPYVEAGNNPVSLPSGGPETAATPPQAR